MTTDQLERTVAFAVLLLHGLGHGGALGALAWIAVRPGAETGAWSAARSWVLPALARPAATVVASAFWVLSLVGFVIAAVGFWFDTEWWRTLAMGMAVVSTSGIVLFLGTWPVPNTVAALVVNMAVILVGAGFAGWSLPR